ncbi:hypothetical protein M404DRAFT_88602, partial [Pisolithus tinctorius Marx 270]
FVTAISTRALIFIDAALPDVGLLCFVAIGLGEVSTCKININEDDALLKGDPLGMFQLGGYTHCLFFRRCLKVT